MAPGFTAMGRVYVTVYVTCVCNYGQCLSAHGFDLSAGLSASRISALE
jgi:hypothetical protein